MRSGLVFTGLVLGAGSVIGLNYSIPIDSGALGSPSVVQLNSMCSGTLEQVASALSRS